MFIIHCNLNYIGKEVEIISNERSWDNMCRNITNFINKNNLEYKIFLSPYRKLNEKSIYKTLRKKYKQLLINIGRKNIYLAGVQGCSRHDIIAVNINNKNLNDISNILLNNGAVHYNKGYNYKGDLLCKR